MIFRGKKENLSRMQRLRREKRVNRQIIISSLIICLCLVRMIMPIASRRVTEEGVKEYYSFYTGIWGTWGIVSHTETDWGWRTRTYYAFSKGMFVDAARTGTLAGDDKGDFPVDIDGDGVKELICNEQSPEGQVYAKAVALRSGKFEEGYIELSEELLCAYPWWGGAAVQVCYAPSRKVYDICYYSQDGKMLGVKNIALDEACYSWDSFWTAGSEEL